MIANLLPQWKVELPWLKNAPGQSVESQVRFESFYFACGEMVQSDRSMKYEPTEAATHE